MNLSIRGNSIVIVALLFVLVLGNSETFGQLQVGFGEIFGEVLPPDWVVQNKSSGLGPTSVFPGIGAADGFFDAQSGDPYSYLAMNYRNAALENTDVTSTWVITPEVPLTKGTVISFYTRTIVNSPFPDRLVVRISENGASVETGFGPFAVGDFQTVLLDLNPEHEIGGFPEKWTRFEIELQEFVQPTGRVAFHYFNEFMNVNGNYVGIDSFRFVPMVLGDVNCDGVVDLLDVSPFVDLIVNSIFSPKGDMNQDGTVDLLDLEPFVDAIANVS